MISGENKKEGGGSSRQLSNNTKVSVSAEHLSLRKLPRLWLSSQKHRYIQKREHRLDVAEKLSTDSRVSSGAACLRAEPLPFLLLLPQQGEAPHSAQLWGGRNDPPSQNDPACPSDRLTHLAAAASSRGAEYTQPMVGAGKRQTKSRRAAVSVCKGRCGGTELT